MQVTLAIQAASGVATPVGLTNPLLRGDSTAGGVASFKRLSAAVATTGVIKAAPGQVFMGELLNTNVAIRYLHLYDKAVAPTLNVDTPVITIPFAASSAKSLASVAGLSFLVGCAYAVTTDDAAVPVTAGAAGDIQGTIGYA